MNEFDEILEECIDEITNGASSLEDCLIRYPEYAEQLEPVLYTVVRLQEAGEVSPPPFLRARIRTELRQAMKNHPRQKNPGSWFFWRIALNVALLVLVFMMTSTAFAQRALPGESLYTWKLASESLWRAVAVDPLEADLQLSDRRISEYVAVSRDEQRRTEVLLGYNKLLVRFKDEQDETDRARILSVLKSQQDSLRKVGLSIPELDSYFSNGVTETGEALPLQTPDSPSSRPAP